MKAPKKGKKAEQQKVSAKVQAAQAMEGVGGKSVAGKTMSSMSGEKLAHVEANLGKTLKAKVNKAVKQTVVEVFLISIPFKLYVLP